MAKKQKQPTKTCADCIHESACRVWTDGRYISDAAASQCPNHETVKESGAYLCGVLDERKRKQTNADRIRAMTDEELADMFAQFEFSMAKEVCAIFGVDITIIEHDFGASAKEELEWLKQPAKGE